MDPRKNPFAPGAGSPPPALVGRDSIIEAADIALHRIRDGRPEKSQMLLGLRGVGKTVLLNRIAEIARGLGYLVVKLEAPEGQRLAAYLAPALKATLIQLSRSDKAKDLASQALAALRGFAASRAHSKSPLGSSGLVSPSPRRLIPATWKSIWRHCSSRSDGQRGQMTLAWSSWSTRFSI